MRGGCLARTFSDHVNGDEGLIQSGYHERVTITKGGGVGKGVEPNL